MPVIYQQCISRDDPVHNPKVLYLFGDNELRLGRGGQAAYGRTWQRINTVGIRTKREPSMADDAFWTDAHYDANVQMIADDFRRVHTHLANGGTVVVPADGIGTGMARLQYTAPRTFAYLQSHLETIKGFQP